MIEPLPGYETPTGAARRSVMRSAIIFTPIFLVLLVTLVAMIADRAGGGSGGSVLLIIIVGLLTVLFGFQSITALRDLRTAPRETQGVVHRKWSRSEVIFWRSYYIGVGRDIFRISALAYHMIETGNEVLIVHLTHTSAVESVSIIREERPALPATSSEEQGEP